jgi:hypothetical protein
MNPSSAPAKDKKYRADEDDEWRDRDDDDDVGPAEFDPDAPDGDVPAFLQGEGIVLVGCTTMG